MNAFSRLGMSSVIGMMVMVAPVVLGGQASVVAQEVTPEGMTAEELLAEGDRLFQQGVQQYENGQLEEALQSWQYSRDIFQNPIVRHTFPQDSLRKEDSILEYLSLLINPAQLYEEAIELFQQRLDIARELGDRNREAAVLNSMGSTYGYWGEYQKCINFLEESLAIAREIDDRTIEQSSLMGLGGAYSGLGQQQKALEFLEQSLHIAREIENSIAEFALINMLSLIYSELDQVSQETSLFDQDLAIPQNIRDYSVDGLSLIALGLNFSDFGQYSQAINLFEQALEIAREIDNRDVEGMALGELASVYTNLSAYEQAILFANQSLDIAREMNDRTGEGVALNILGGVYASQGQYQQAIHLLEQALELAREVNRLDGESAVLNQLGNVYSALGNYQQAITLYNQSLSIARETDDRASEGVSLGNLGNVYSSLGDYQQAITLHHQSLDILRGVGDRASEGSTLGNLGNAYKALGEYQQAITLYNQSLDIAREIGDRSGEGNSLSNLGSVYQGMGQYREAISFHEQSLAIAQEIEDRASRGEILGNLGHAYLGLGQYARAIDLFQQGLENAQDIGNRPAEGIALGNLGVAYRNLGQYEQALEHHQKRLDIAIEVGEVTSEGIAWVNLGNVYHNLGEYPQAIDSLERGLSISRQVGHRPGEGVALASLGNIYLEQRQPQESIEFYQKSLVIFREIGDRANEGLNLDNLGMAYFLMEQYPQAIASFSQGLFLAQETGDLQNKATSLRNLGILFIHANQLEKAEDILRQSMKAFETLRVQLPDDQLISLIDAQLDVYKMLSYALVLQEKTIDALMVSEQGRAQAFALKLNRRLGQSSNVDFSIQHIQQLAHDTDTTLVEYVMLGDHWLYIWVVQPSGQIDFRSVELEGANDPAFTALTTLNAPLYRGTPEPSQVDTLVADTRNAINTATVGVRRKEQTDRLKELHQLLIDPIADLLPTDPEAKVAFIPQGSLFLVPFPALQDENDTYLIEKHTILTAPSIQVLGLAYDTAQDRAAQTSEASTNALIVGNPTMPTVSLPIEDDVFEPQQLPGLIGAELEAEAIATFFNTTALTRDQATEAAIKQQLPTADLIHLATHGLLEYQGSRLDIPGAIALAPTTDEDGLLTAGEIVEMELQADLAVLSACDTGLGNITGDGVVGLSRSLITAGVPSVIVSLWAVPDDSTAHLMTEFYHHRQQGLDKAQALRQAMLTVMNQGAYITPEHWAAFTLIGDAG